MYRTHWEMARIGAESWRSPMTLAWEPRASVVPTGGWDRDRLRNAAFQHTFSALPEIRKVSGAAWLRSAGLSLCDQNPICNCC